MDKVGGYLFLAGAIGFEVLGTMFLQKSVQFTRPLPSVAMGLCYCVSLFCLSHALKTMPLGIAYALWGGLGIILTTLVGYLVFRQVLDMAAVIGIGFILIGTATINLFSHAASH